MKKFANWVKKHKALTFFVAVALVAVLVFLFVPKNESAGYTEEIAAHRDIVTYNSFVGNVGFTEEMNVLSMASAKITEVLFEVGDHVSKGDVIAKLDSENLEHNIKQTELALETQRKANEHALADAQRAYDNFKYTLDNGLNSTLNNVKVQKANAEKNLNTLMDSFDDYIEMLESTLEHYPLASGMIDAKNAYYDAKDIYDEYKTFVEDKRAQFGDSPTEEESRELEKYINLLEERKVALENAYADYETAINNYADYNDASFKVVVDNLENATTAYNNACEAYNSVELQLDQQLASYEAALNKAKDTLTLESAENDLKKLKDTLEDYSVTAPCNGIITSLNLDEGNMTAAGSVAATVSNLAELEISIKVDEYSILNTQVGKEVDIYIDSIDRVYKGVITYVASNATIEGGVSYFKATVEFNADEYVRGGMSVEVRLVKTQSLGAVSVAVDAVEYRDDNTAYVLVYGADGHLEERNVTLGVSDGIHIEITDGLAEGDKIYYIPSNFIFMIPGM